MLTAVVRQRPWDRPVGSGGRVASPGNGRYSLTPRTPDDRRDDGNKGSSASAESVAFLLLAGVAVGLGVGAGIDWLVRSSPVWTVIGVFAGFGLALYAIYLETK
jgi:F0F1-type ATP synthase assembly protein I